jgi:hypothetical protein
VNPILGIAISLSLMIVLYAIWRIPLSIYSWKYKSKYMQLFAKYTLLIILFIISISSLIFSIKTYINNK